MDKGSKVFLRHLVEEEGVPLGDLVPSLAQLLRPYLREQSDAEGRKFVRLEAPWHASLIKVLDRPLQVLGCFCSCRKSCVASGEGPIIGIVPFPHVALIDSAPEHLS